MFVDFLNHTCLSLDADVCIIGAGAAGITLAREFTLTHHRVFLLESGSVEPEPETQALYDSEVVGLRHGGIHGARARRFGGTTTLWGGQSMRFEPFDFQVRPWVPHSGWPISRQVLDPYYKRAELVLRLGESPTYEELCSRLRFEAPPFDRSTFRLAVSQWSPNPNFASMYGKELAKSSNIFVILHANATRLLASENSRTIIGVEVKGISGKTEIVRARYYLVCCGAIETARLLLASDQPDPRGIGNSYDLVGRYFMDHIHVDLGRLNIRNRKSLHDGFEGFVFRHKLYSPKIMLSNARQTKSGLLGILSEVILEDLDDSTLVLMKNAYRSLALPEARKAQKILAGVRALNSGLRNPEELASAMWRIYVRGRGAKTTNCNVRLGLQCENAPYRDSRVELSEARDRLGTRKARLYWVVGELERYTLRNWIALLAAELDRLGLAIYDAAQAKTLEDGERWREMLVDGAHQMGTTRMHQSPQFGVVDAECRVYGVDNLYLGSSAVFPTGGYSSPTLTVLALSIRIGDTIKERLKLSDACEILNV